MSCHTVVTVCISILLTCVKSEIYLEPIDSLYLPYQYEPERLYGFDTQAAEQSAYDKTRHLIFTVGQTTLTVINATDPANLRILDHHTQTADAEMTDVEVCGEFIVVGVHNKTARDEGKVVIFTYTTESLLMPILEVIVGPLPDMILPSKDCSTVFVALEAEAYVKDGVIIDPEGGFGIMQWDPTNPTVEPKYRIVNFQKFNARADEYVARGLRFIYRENNNTLAQDLEPEYIAINEDETRAYICLQENSAIAVVNITDLDTADVIDLYPLSPKVWTQSSLDASDKDNAINMKAWPIFGSLMPDAIQYIKHDGQDYLITANEGDTKEYEDSNGRTLFNEELRGAKWTKDDLLDSTVATELRGFLDDNAQLGRQKFTKASGMSNTTAGKFSKLTAYGGRGLSIIRTSDMSTVYDSGDIVERSILERYPPLFNCNSKDHLTPWEGTDGRSDDKGPESESLAYGYLWGKTIIFMGNERPGTVSVFSIDEGSFTPKFESVYFGGVLQAGRTWQEMYDRRTSGDVDPEDVRFISPEDSGIGHPILLVSGSVSGTISMYAVRQKEDQVGPCPSDQLKCRTKKLCVDNKYKCDGVDDCGDNTDESQCGTPAQLVSCSEDQLKCRNKNRCISLKMKCDGVDDCGDNTDEAQCSISTAESEMLRSLMIAAICLGCLALITILGVCCILKRNGNKKGEDELELNSKL